VTFTSDGSTLVFPGFDLVVAQISLTPRTLRHGHVTFPVKCPYTIAYERSAEPTSDEAWLW
jgi:hypothetical protein